MSGENRDVQVVSEGSVNQIEIIPNPIAADPEIVVVESGDSDSLDIMSVFDGMIEEEVKAVSFNPVAIAAEINPGESMMSLFMSVIDRNIHYCQEVKELKAELQMVIEDKMDVESMWEQEHDERVLAKDKVHALKQEVFELRSELKTKKQKIERMSYIHRSAHEDFQLQVAGYPVETGQTRHTISRDIIAGLAKADFENALRQI